MLSKMVKGFVIKQPLDNLPNIYLSINRTGQSKQKNRFYRLRLTSKQNIFLSLFSQEEI